MNTTKILIGGEFVLGEGSFDVVSPFSGETVASVGEADEDQALAALAASKKAAVEMRVLSKHRVREGLVKLSQGIAERRNEFAKQIAIESAKPLVYARAEVDRAVSTFRIAAVESERFEGGLVSMDESPLGAGRSAKSHFEPKGVIFGITPFNFPLNLVAHKVAPALASGNSIIIKPSEKTPLTALLLGEVFLECGLPTGALQVVPMGLDVLHQALSDERVDMISFTGSDRVGWELLKKYPRKVLALELGGNAPVIVDDTCDLEDAASRIAVGAFAYSGQVCISVQRIIVHKNVEKQLTESLIKRSRALKFGDPLEENTGISVMISKEAAKNAIEIVDQAVKNGARVVFGGNHRESYLEPTLLTNVDPEMRVVSDEVFAPVATIESFESFSGAIASANQTRFGLQAGVFTRKDSHAEEAARDLEYGGVIVNDVPTFRVDNMPYGGIKDSGIGREGVRYAMEEMCDLKLVVSR